MTSAFNEDEILSLVKYGEGVGADVRFIEYMPFAGNDWRLDKIFSYDDIIASLTKHYKPSNIEKVEDAFNNLPNHIAEIKDLEWGINNSPEGKDQGFTHCFILSFADEAGRATYRPHPKHKEFGEILTPHLDKVLVVDYWAK